MKTSIVLVLLGLLVDLHCSEACTTPKVFHTYSSSDILMSSETVFIVEFDMVCDASEFPVIHAFVGGQLIPLARSLGGNRYQLSWSVPHKDAVTGTQTINLYTEEGSNLIRKALRYNEELTAKPLFSVQFEHKGVKTWNWFAPSFVAVVASLLIWWLAYSTKSKLQE